MGLMSLDERSVHFAFSEYVVSQMHKCCMIFFMWGS